MKAGADWAFLRDEFRNPLLVLGGLVGLLLVIACTNIANLLLARAVARQKEVAMRISLGCSQVRLMRQFLTESALLAGLGGAASIVVAYLTANLLGRFLAGRENLPIAVALDCAYPGDGRGDHGRGAGGVRAVPGVAGVAAARTRPGSSKAPGSVGQGPRHNGTPDGCS